MPEVKTFEDLDVWQKSKNIALEIFKLTSKDSFTREWGIRDQLRRASFSISSNIAEGFEYNNNPDFIRYLKYAKGSAGELRSQINILYSAGWFNEQEFNQMNSSLIEISKSIGGFIKYLRQSKKTKSN